jgi:hypothetical protein
MTNKSPRGQMERKKNGESSFSRKKRGIRAIKTRKKSIIILKRMKIDLNRKGRLSSNDSNIIIIGERN